MIYPVRPMNCREAYGSGNCDSEKAGGTKTVTEEPDMFAERELRVQVRQLQAYGRQSGEICSLITMLLDPKAQIVADPANQKLMTIQPELLSDDDIIWGLGVRPMKNPIQE